MTLRTFARPGAVTLLAAGALVLGAGPALAAAEVDFGVSVTGTTVAAGADGKFGTLKLANLGTTEAKTIGVRFDATGLDESKVKLDLDGCTFTDGVADCILQDAKSYPKPGTTTDLTLPLVKQAGATGAAGKLRVTVVVEGDTVKGNDTAEVNVEIAGSGVDLRVIADDVTTSLADDGDVDAAPVRPGGLTNVHAYVLNQGDRTADGITISVTLPKGATFSTEFEGCAVSNGVRTLTCQIDGPYVPYEDAGEDRPAGFMISATLKVAKSVTGPVTLKGGVTSAAANGVVAESARLRKPAALPAGFTALTKADIARLDVDGSDNTDGFVVEVGAAPAPPASGGGDGGGAGAGDPSLPTTGPVAAIAGGVGALVVVGGGLLLIAARRRRLVLVAPVDGK